MPRALSRFHLPHTLVLFVVCIVVAAVLTHVLPAGQYERREDPVTGRSAVVPGTYAFTEAQPVGAFQAMVAIPKGMQEAASVVFLVFLVGGAFAVVERTGALHRGVDRLVERLAHRQGWIIPVTCCCAFALGGALENMEEEIIAFVPVLLLLCRRLGYDAVTAVAISIGASMVSAAFSPINPFQVVIAQQLADVPPLSGSLFRLGFGALALGLWIWGTVRYAARTRTAPEAGAVELGGPLEARHIVVLLLVVGAFALLVVGVLTLGWGFDELSALFFIMGASAGLIGRLGVNGTAEAFVDGFRSMAFAALLVGFARAIYVVLDQGRILDTIVHGLFTPIAELPLLATGFAMLIAQTAIHVPVPSVSGQAVLTIPILVPLGDLLGLSRQVTVLAYQYGAGLCELITPTNGALMAMLAASGVGYDRWLGFVLRLYLALLALGAAAIAAAISFNLR